MLPKLIGRTLGLVAMAGILCTSAHALLITGGSGGAGGTAITGIGNQCLEVPGAATTAPIVAVESWDCWAGPNQTWILTNGEFQRINNGSFTCMEVAGSGTTAGSLVQLNTCTGAKNQLWIVQAGGAIENVNAKLCLDWGAGYTSNGVQLTVQVCSGAAAQKFWLK